MVVSELHQTVKSAAKNIIIVLVAFGCVGLLTLLAINISFLSPVAQVVREFSLSDVYYHVLYESGEVDTSRVITIVDMTELQRRDKIVDVMQEIESLNPKAVGVDIVFEGLKDDTLGDARLRQLAKTYSANTIYSYRMLDYIDDSIGYAEDVHSFFVEEGVEVMEGFTDFERALYGGMKRKLSLRRRCRGEERTSLVNNVLNVYTDGQMTEGRQRELAINFHPKKFLVVPSDSVTQYGELIKDHIVLFGATHELTDMHYTPLGKMAGIELLAYSLQTLLEQTQVRLLPLWLTVVISFLVAMLSWYLLMGYSRMVKRCRSEILRFFLSTTFIKGFFIFVWIAFLMWLAFLVFCNYHISVNLGWGVAIIPFLYGAQEFCSLMTKMVRRLN